MNRMNQREFINVLGGATAITMAIPGLASTSTTDKTVGDVTSLYVKGLVMVDLGNSDLIRLGFPKAPGHKATLSVVPQSGTKQVLAITGNGSIQAKAIASEATTILHTDEIRKKEFYGDDVKSHVDRCPGTISIPRNAIRSVTASELTSARYTFVRTDTGEEVTSFRPRQLADALK